jgi:AcrR family transcriptional regulator
VTASPAASDTSERARAQRERILDAARRCFVERGFQGASMDDIARTAGMSAGLLYRYFDRKGAIVRAIIDRQMEEARSLLDQLGSADDIVAAILDHFDAGRQPEGSEMSAALFLEMTAEAVRDPEIGAATRAADALVRERLEGALRRSAAAAAPGTPPLDPASVARRVLALQCVIEGLIVRAVRQPDLDRETLKACLQGALAGLSRG